LDEGHSTERVVAAYATSDGVDGNAAASLVMPARRALWRVCEAYCPRRLAAALRTRLGPTDHSGGDGIRELRRALVDWLDPPPQCKRCRRRMASGSEDDSCPHAKFRVERYRKPKTQGGRNRLHPRVLAALDHVDMKPDADGLYTLEVQAPCVARRRRPGDSMRLSAGGTLPLFSAAQIDAGVAHHAGLAAGLARWSDAYDVLADRDARALLAATGDPQAAGPGHAAHLTRAFVEQYYAALQAGTAAQGSGARAVQQARHALDQAVNNAVEANGRIALSMQLRYFTPVGAITRADLIQGGAMGLRRAAIDFDPAQAKFTTYAVAWVRQGMGEQFARRDMVATPDWVLSVRRAIDARSPHVSAQEMLAALEDLVATRGDATKASDATQTLLDIVSQAVTPRALKGSPAPTPVALPSVPAGIAALLEAVLGLHFAALAKALAKARGKPTRKKISATIPRAAAAASEEHLRARVAAVLGRWLGLAPADESAVSGAGVLAALRHGAPVVLSISAGGEEEEYADGDAGRGGTGGSVVLAEVVDDFEVRLADEEEAAQQWSGMRAALGALRKVDPLAAEVVRRHHALDGLDEETFEAIGTVGAGPDRTVMSREKIRLAYGRGRKFMRAMVGPASALR